MPAVSPAVKQAVVPSTANSVPILARPQLGPHKGGPYNPTRPVNVVLPVVPNTLAEQENQPPPPASPGYGGWPTRSSQKIYGSEGAPSVPRHGFMFTAPPIDSHYTSELQIVEPVKRVNSPATRGMQTWVQPYQNHIAQTPQDVDPNGFRIEPPQQRTSWMRITTPPHGIGYAPEIYNPRQNPQATNIYKYAPQLGTQAYGTGVLNSDTFGAGQTAGGIGGSNYTPQPGPPPTTSTAGSMDAGSAMPTWG
jgi:hypothetical protein